MILSGHEVKTPQQKKYLIYPEHSFTSHMLNINLQTQDTGLPSLKIFTWGCHTNTVASWSRHVTAIIRNVLSSSGPVTTTDCVQTLQLWTKLPAPKTKHCQSNCLIKWHLQMSLELTASVQLHVFNTSYSKSTKARSLSSWEEQCQHRCLQTLTEEE